MDKPVKIIRSASDIDQDQTYFPSECISAYLAEEFLASLAAMTRNKYPDADEIIRNIEDIEQIHKRAVCTAVSEAEAERLIESITLGYRNKHKKWMHHEDAYVHFYNLLNGKDVF